MDDAIEFSDDRDRTMRWCLRRYVRGHAEEKNGDECSPHLGPSLSRSFAEDSCAAHARIAAAFPPQPNHHFCQLMAVGMALQRVCRLTRSGRA